MVRRDIRGGTSWFRAGNYVLTRIAETGGRFTGFEPYVAAINDRGTVAFQATVEQGGSGVFTGDGGPITSTIELPTGGYREVISHPDIDELGAVCMYALSTKGRREVIRVDGGDITLVDHDAGPLGPTVNSAGAVAYRVATRSGKAAIRKLDGRARSSIAETGDVFGAFAGLPVIDNAGAVAFRAALSSDVQAVFVGDGAAPAVVASTGDAFESIGQFPTINDAGSVAFVASQRDGTSGVYVAMGGVVVTVIDTTSAFESFRGVLIDKAGHVVFYATPRAGQLGVFGGPDPGRDRIVGLGSSLFGSAVVDFALNPVSINESGQIAIRVTCADARQFIVRADPVA